MQFLNIEQEYLNQNYLYHIYNNINMYHYSFFFLKKQLPIKINHIILIIN